MVIILSWNRRQVEVLNNDRSGIQKREPQGIVLGPLLFIVIINDLTDTGSSNLQLVYADDTNYCINHSTNEETFIQANISAEQFDN